MYYIIYKIANKTNGKIYIGSHKTKNLNDGYMGSGKYLRRAIEKHGKDNFTKEILFIYDNPESMYTKEAELVNEDFLIEENTYNLKVGGFGGWDYVNDNPDKFLTQARLDALMTNKERVRRWKYKYNNDLKFKEDHIIKSKSASEKAMLLYPNGIWFNRKHSEKTKLLLSEIKKGTGKGNKNSQFGSKWYHNVELQISKKIKKGEEIPEGFIAGRFKKRNKL